MSVSRRAVSLKKFPAYDIKDDNVANWDLYQTNLHCGVERESLGTQKSWIRSHCVLSEDSLILTPL